MTWSLPCASLKKDSDLVAVHLTGLDKILLAYITAIYSGKHIIFKPNPPPTSFVITWISSSLILSVLASLSLIAWGPWLSTCILNFPSVLLNIDTADLGSIGLTTILLLIRWTWDTWCASDSTFFHSSSEPKPQSTAQLVSNSSNSLGESSSRALAVSELHGNSS